MKSSYAVYRKLREVKYKYLVDFYKRYLRKIPANCKYNYLYKIKDENGAEYKIRLCLLHQENLDMKSGIYPHLVDVCQYEKDCRQCNAFIPRHSKEEIKQIFEKDLEKNKKSYPEIYTLEWVLERSAVGIPPFNWIQSLFYAIKRLFTKNKMF